MSPILLYIWNMSCNIFFCTFINIGTLCKLYSAVYSGYVSCDCLLLYIAGGFFT
jgi:hypothetical protein